MSRSAAPSDRRPRAGLLPITVLLAGLVATATAADPAEAPWRRAGLDDRQAAAHLLDRFAFGPRPGDVDRVVEHGLEAWFEDQLATARPETDLERRVAGYDLLRMDAEELARALPGPAIVLRRAVEAGVISQEMAGDLRASLREMEPAQRWAVQRDLAAFAREQGFRRQEDLEVQLTGNKVLSAVYAENQLREVMTDFWFNHFNVAGSKPEVRPYLLAYERDAIRPHVLGGFRRLLGATARHPAMLGYLDNARSTAEADATTLLDLRRGRAARGSRFGRAGAPGRRGRMPAAARNGRSIGLNENYARELLELHTLGVDGGYGQEDVVAVARAFTGWTVIPPGPAGEEIEARLEAMGPRLERAGFVRDGLFLFRADAHDADVKRVLGRRLAAGRGLEDGEEVLDLLATHPSTAHHLATKLAVRFVADEPPPALVDRLAATFTASGGDVAATLRALFHSPELWAPEARAAKIRSPLELAASALRGLDAEVRDPAGVVRALAALGQRLYLYEAPTGFPDRAETWVGTGTLLARMNFGLVLAAGRLEGVAGTRLDGGWAAFPAADGGGGEPESLQAGLERVFRHLLPERDPAPSVAALLPLAGAGDLGRRLAEAGVSLPGASLPGAEGNPAAAADGPYTPLQQVAGLVLGSPEFQRR